MLSLNHSFHYLKNTKEFIDVIFKRLLMIWIFPHLVFQRFYMDYKMQMMVKSLMNLTKNALFLDFCIFHMVEIH